MIEILIIIGIIVYLTKNKRNNSNQRNYRDYYPQSDWQQKSEITHPKSEDEKNYIDGYQPKKLLSKHETAAYKAIKEIVSEKGYTVFTKIRLLDLVEPKITHNNEKAYLWKIQAKHVDFVVCDENLTAKWIIELQDSSHKREDRIERDNLVKAILSNCNYKILMTYTATPDEIRTFLNIPPKIRAGEDLSGLPAQSK